MQRASTIMTPPNAIDSNTSYQYVKSASRTVYRKRVLLLQPY